MACRESPTTAIVSISLGYSLEHLLMYPLPSRSVIVDGYYLRFNYITPIDAGRYYCSASNVHGNATKVAEVLVNRGTIVDRPATSNYHEVYLGDSVALKCAVPLELYEPGISVSFSFFYIYF